MTLLLLVVLGAGATTALAPPGRVLDPMRVAFWFPIGCGIVSICAFLLQVIHRGAFLLWIEFALTALFAAIAIRIRAAPAHVSSTENVRPIVAGVAFATAAVAAAWAFYLLAVHQPYGGWDAFSHWNFHARFIEALGDRWLHSIRDPSFRPLVSIDHPLMLAEVSASVGSDRAIIVACGFAVSAVLLLIGLAARLSGMALGLAAGIALLCLREFSSVTAWQYADVPLAAFILAAIGLLALARESDGCWMLLAGIAAGMAAWTKSEGLAFTIAAVATLFCGARMRRTPIQAMTRFGAGALIPLAVTLLFRSHYAIPNWIAASQGIHATARRVVDIDRYAMLARLFGCFVGRHAIACVAIGVFTVAQRFDRQRVRENAWLAAILALYVVSYAAAVIIGPAAVEWQVRTTIDRVAVHIWPATVLLLMQSLRRPSEPV